MGLLKNLLKKLASGSANVPLSAQDLNKSTENTIQSSTNLKSGVTTSHGVVDASVINSTQLHIDTLLAVQQPSLPLGTIDYEIDDSLPKEQFINLTINDHPHQDITVNVNVDPLVITSTTAKHDDESEHNNSIPPNDNTGLPPLPPPSAIKTSTTTGDMLQFNSPSPPQDHITNVNSNDGPTPLSSMVYLTEDGENMAETMSLISDGFTEEELIEDLRDLHKALEAIEEFSTSSPHAITTVTNASNNTNNNDSTSIKSDSIAIAPTITSNTNTTLQPASTNTHITFNNTANTTANTANTSLYGTSPESISNLSIGTSTGTGHDYYAKNMVKLYNDLAVRLMDACEYDQALGMLMKAEVLLDTSSAWIVLTGEERKIFDNEDPGTASQLGNSDLTLLPLPGGVDAINDDSINDDTTTNNDDGAIDSMPVNTVNDADLIHKLQEQYNIHITETQTTTIDDTTTTMAVTTTAAAGTTTTMSIADKLAAARIRLRAITYNNIGCLYKRKSMPEKSLVYLQNALSLEISSGNVHHCASTHLNLCAAYSALEMFKESLGHAERAILLLQRQLWGPTATTFQDGVAYLSGMLSMLCSTAKNGGSSGGGNVISNGGGGSSSMATTTSSTPPSSSSSAMNQHKRHQQLMSSVNLLAMAYHNAAVEHERLHRLREAQVSYSRSCALGTKFLGTKSTTTISLVKAQKAFVSRQQKERTSMAHGSSNSLAASGLATAHHNHGHYHHGSSSNGGVGMGRKGAIGGARSSAGSGGGAASMSSIGSGSGGGGSSSSSSTSSAAAMYSSTKIRQSSAGKRTSVLGGTRSVGGMSRHSGSHSSLASLKSGRDRR